MATEPIDLQAEIDHAAAAAAAGMRPLIHLWTTPYNTRSLIMTWVICIGYTSIMRVERGISIFLLRLLSFAVVHPPVTLKAKNSHHFIAAAGAAAAQMGRIS